MHSVTNKEKSFIPQKLPFSFVPGNQIIAIYSAVHAQCLLIVQFCLSFMEWDVFLCDFITWIRVAQSRLLK